MKNVNAISWSQIRIFRSHYQPQSPFCVKFYWFQYNFDMVLLYDFNKFCCINFIHGFKSYSKHSKFLYGYPVIELNTKLFDWVIILTIFFIFEWTELLLSSYLLRFCKASVELVVLISSNRIIWVHTFTKYNI